MSKQRKIELAKYHRGNGPNRYDSRRDKIRTHSTEYILAVNNFDTNQLSYVWRSLDAFVKEGMKDRDPTHGYEHMKAVAIISMDILYNLFKNVDKIDEVKMVDIYNEVMIVAWLHDYADHKYDIDGTLQAEMNSFIQNLCKKEASSIQEAIYYVSYSKENAIFKQILKDDDDYQASNLECTDTTKHDWSKVLNRKYMLIRDIVSDADKYEAIGKQGIERCAEYGREYFSRHGMPIDDQSINIHVIKHVEVKLAWLYLYYIRTWYGKQISKPRHDEMMLIFDDMVRAQYNI
jgi:HD superfamily phosphodiesterase